MYKPLHGHSHVNKSLFEVNQWVIFTKCLHHNSRNCDQAWLQNWLWSYPTLFMLNPSWVGTAWEQYTWTQLLGFSNLTSHSYSIPGLVKVYYCYPRGLGEYTCSADFPNLSVACPSLPCPLIWIYKLFPPILNQIHPWARRVYMFCRFPKSVCSTSSVHSSPSQLINYVEGSSLWDLPKSH